MRSKFFEQGLNNSSPENKAIKPLPPPPPAPLSPSDVGPKSPLLSPPSFNLGEASKQVASGTKKQDSEKDSSVEQSAQDIQDDDFGDFQTAG